MPLIDGLVASASLVLLPHEYDVGPMDMLDDGVRSICSTIPMFSNGFGSDGLEEVGEARLRGHDVSYIAIRLP